MGWIELKEGCEMPRVDEFVLWRTEDDNYFVQEIDKDDPDWWNGTPLDGGRQWRPKCTHWSRIIGPGEEPNQEELWDEALIQLAVVNGYSDIDTAKKDLMSRYTLYHK